MGDVKKRKKKQRTRKRAPPQLKENCAVEWISSTKIEDSSEREKSPSPEGLSIAQQTQYSVLRRRGGWVEVRDELNNEVFYVELETLKTTWNVHDSPFEPPKQSINALTRTLRECKMDRWKQLLGEDPEPLSPTTIKRKLSASISTPLTPQDMISSFTKGQSFRLGITSGITCPYTGNTYPSEDYLSLARLRKIEVRKLLQDHGVHPDAIYITEPEVSHEDQAQYNLISRTCFKTMLTSALRWSRSQGGDRAAKVLDNRLQKLFSELKYENSSLHASINTCRGSPLRTMKDSIKKASAGSPTNKKPIITIGTKVVPHPTNWHWGSHEHCYCFGTVVSVHVLTGWVEVRWSATGISEMRKWPEELQFYTEPGDNLEARNE
eukprot:TRINITY_DN9933_c2_g1_i2.p1 TRINITY_DN9933_c2_g1~~TRINITY_DN9933_c2_g1_i2.p1  ORF type:complete len:379 (+),score=38.39 TRINITY_DN9933_c2_g1_i2:45-1181(+)